MTSEVEEKETIVKYMEGYLHKKEDRNKWLESWVILERRHLFFHRQKPERINEHLIGWVELTPDTKCTMGKKRGYTFPFYVEKQKKRYLFKTTCHLSRHQWVKAIEASVSGEPPQIVPRTLSAVNRNYSGSTKNKTITKDYIVETTAYKEINLSNDGASDHYGDWENQECPGNISDTFSNNRYNNIGKSNTISITGRTSYAYNSIRTKIFSLRVLQPPLEEAVTLL